MVGCRAASAAMCGTPDLRPPRSARETLLASFQCPQTCPSLDGEAASLPSIHPHNLYYNLPKRDSRDRSPTALHLSSLLLYHLSQSPTPMAVRQLTSHPLKWATFLGRHSQPSSSWEMVGSAGGERKNTGPANGWHQVVLDSGFSGLLAGWGVLVGQGSGPVGHSITVLLCVKDMESLS